MEGSDWLNSIVFPYVNFLIFFVVLLIVAKKPIKGILEKKKEDYEKIYKQAVELKEKAEAQSKQVEEQYSRLDDELRRIKEMAEKDAKEESQKIIAMAEENAAQLKANTEQLIKGEMAKAQEALRRQLVEMAKEHAVELASKTEVKSTDEIKKVVNHLSAT